MAHIHTKPDQVDHTVTAYIVRTDDLEPKILLHRHKKLNRLLPVGGHIELNETPWAAVIREVDEEAGYRLDQLEVIQPPIRISVCSDVVVHPQAIFSNTHAITKDHYHSDTAYLLCVSSDPAQALQDGESAELRWFSRSEIDFQPMPENIRQVCLTVFDSLLDNWQSIPASSFSLKTNP